MKEVNEAKNAWRSEKKGIRLPFTFIHIFIHVSTFSYLLIHILALIIIIGKEMQINGQYHCRIIAYQNRKYVGKNTTSIKLKILEYILFV